MSDDSLPVYRSISPVPARVDMAWERGFKAGQVNALRWLGVPAVISCWRLMREGGFPLPVAVLLVLMLAVVAVPCCTVAATVHRITRYRRRRQPLTVDLVLMDDGSVF